MPNARSILKTVLLSAILSSAPVWALAGYVSGPGQPGAPFVGEPTGMLVLSAGFGLVLAGRRRVAHVSHHAGDVIDITSHIRATSLQGPADEAEAAMGGRGEDRKVA